MNFEMEAMICDLVDFVEEAVRILDLASFWRVNVWSKSREQ